MSSYALYIDGKRAARHSTRLACLIEAFERKRVVRVRWRLELAGAEIRKDPADD